MSGQYVPQLEGIAVVVGDLRRGAAKAELVRVFAHVLPETGPIQRLELALAAVLLGQVPKCLVVEFDIALDPIQRIATLFVRIAGSSNTHTALVVVGHRALFALGRWDGLQTHEHIDEPLQTALVQRHQRFRQVRRDVEH